MSDTERATVSLTLHEPKNLADVAKWAGLATGLGFPRSSPVTVPFGALSVRVTAYIDQTVAPVDGD